MKCGILFEAMAIFYTFLFVFSKSCQYAIQSVLYIALHGDASHPVKTKTISETQEIPLHFLGKVMQTLVKHKVLHSIKGPTGGFLLVEGISDINLLAIVKIIDGLDIFSQCGIGLRACSDTHPCPIHEEYKSVKEKIKHLLESKTIGELCEDVHQGKYFCQY